MDEVIVVLGVQLYFSLNCDLGIFRFFFREIRTVRDYEKRRKRSTDREGCGGEVRLSSTGFFSLCCNYNAVSYK